MTWEGSLGKRATGRTLIKSVWRNCWKVSASSISFSHNSDPCCAVCLGWMRKEKLIYSKVSSSILYHILVLLAQYSKWFGWCVLRASAVKCQVILLIDPQSTSWPTTDGHIDRYSANTQSTSRSTCDWQLVDSQKSVNRHSYVLINTQWHVYKNKLILNLDVNEVSIKCQLRFRWSIDRVLIEGIDQGYWSTHNHWCL